VLRISTLVALASCAALWTAFAPTAVARVSTYTGQFQCDDRGVVTPLAGMNVELWGRGSPDFLPVEWVGYRVAQGFTGADGSFAMRTHDNDDNYFVRMALRDAHGVHLRDFWGINDWSVDTAQRRNNVRTQDYGGMVFSTPGQSHKCAIWAGVHSAYERYRAEIGAGLPSNGVELQADAVTAGVPFTPGTSILWPGGFPVGYGGGGDDSITRHEFGHVIRHGFDGDFGHFLGDVIAHNYLQNHEPCNHTSPGFAFNEGWAEFWAEDFAPAPDYGRPGDMETEGNVAAALQELMVNCAGGQRKPMVETLQRNPGTIHSSAEFRDRLGCPIPRLFPVFVIAAKTAPAAPIVPATLRADVARDEVTATAKRLKGLNKSLDLALDRAEDPPACKKEPCKTALKTLTRPPAIEFEIKLAKIQLNAAAQYDTAYEQTQLAGGSIEKLLEGKAKRERADGKKAIRAALTGVKDALEAARPVFKADSSKLSKDVRRKLTKAAARFRKATKKGATRLPGGLLFQPEAFQLPERVPVIPAPPETPVPGPIVVQRAATSLTIASCPANVAKPKPIEVAGSLTPAQAGSEVKVVFQFPSAAPVVVVASTDAAGNWSAAHTPGPNQVGVWSIDASFAGDGKRLSSNATTCQTKYS